tara:strand:- start:242 stop:850 length:609 start_codon:yes stop_codon:yes gene_type:complete
MFKNIYLKATLLSSVLLFISCDKDDTPDAENEMEVFTKAVIVVTNLSDNSSVTYEFEVEEHDHDHDHGVLVQNQEGDDHGDHTEIELESSSEYKFEITFFNESDPNNVIDMTEEVIEEKDEHHVFYELIGDGISYDTTTGDTRDSDGNALNLVTKWTTTNATVVDVKAYLIHQPTSKTGTTRDDFGGATDVEIEFEAHVESE